MMSRSRWLTSDVGVAVTAAEFVLGWNCGKPECLSDGRLVLLRGVVFSFLDFVWGVTFCSIKGLVSRVFARYYYKIFSKHTSIENKEVNTTYKALLL